MTRRQRIVRFGAMAFVIALGLAALAPAPGIVLETLGVFLLLVGLPGPVDAAVPRGGAERGPRPRPAPTVRCVTVTPRVMDSGRA